MAVLSVHVGLSFCMFFSVFIFFLGTVHCDEQGDKKQKIIDVKPGGVEHDYTEKIGELTCKFTYVCQGGTNEEWVMTLTQSKDKAHYTCGVERPSGTSYLFFQSFKMEIQGAKIIEAAAFADAKTILKSKEYSVDSEKGIVTHRDGAFDSHLAKLDVFAAAGRDEL